MSRCAIIRGSGPRSAVSASSRPSGAMSKSLGRRFPRRQREAGARQRVAAAAGRHVAHEDVRLAAVGEPMVPEAELRALRDVRLDLRVLALLLALRLLGVGGEIRPHPRDERDPLAVREPFDRGAARRERREAARLAAVRRDQIDLRLVVVLALRGERDQVSGRRPLGIAVLLARGQAARLRGRTCRQGPSGTATAPSSRCCRPCRTIVTAAQASPPSGASVGTAMRLIAHSASTVSGGLRLARRTARGGLVLREAAGIGIFLCVQCGVAILPSAPVAPGASRRHISMRTINT